MIGSRKGREGEREGGREQREREREKMPHAVSTNAIIIHTVIE